jgi:hypothetical protein
MAKRVAKSKPKTFIFASRGMDKRVQVYQKGMAWCFGRKTSKQQLLNGAPRTRRILLSPYSSRVHRCLKQMRHCCAWLISWTNDDLMMVDGT